MRIKHQGFTLVEILIALFIFAIISLLIASGLSTILNVKARLESRATELKQLAFVSVIASRDIASMVEREPIASSLSSSKASWEADASHLAFWHMTERMTTTLDNVVVWVRYTCAPPHLYRDTTSNDNENGSRVARESLLSTLSSCEMSYLDQDLRWQSRFTPSAKSPMPRAVKWVLRFKQGKTWERLFDVMAEPPNDLSSSDKK